MSMTTSGVWWCSKRTRWAGPALHPLVAPHKRTSRYRATEGGSVAEANRATLELEPLPGGAVSAPRRQFNKKRSGSWMCGNGRSVKTRHQKWSSETGGRHDASMAEFRTRRPRHICETSRCRAVFERSSYVSRWRRTGWLGRRDSNLCILESEFAKTLSRGRDSN